MKTILFSLILLTISCKLLYWLLSSLYWNYPLTSIAADGQAFTLTSLPALFSGSGQTVVEGSVIWLYCEASSTSPTLTVTWNKDNTEIVEDVPRIFTRRSTSGSYTTFLLGVDNLQVSDGGTYQCSVQDGADIVTGDMISLTGNVLV